MTRKRKSSASPQPKKRSRSPFTTGLLSLIILLVILFALDRLGLIEVDWQGLLSGEDLETVISGQTATPAPNSGPPVVTTPISGEWYQLYFSTPAYPDIPASRRQTIMQGLINALNSAQKSLDVAIYELNLDEVGDALLAAHQRGVTVRLVTDSDSLAEDETLIRLNKAKLPIVPDERSAIMHDKFVVVDGQAVWTGSWNFTSNDTYRNNNNGIYIQSPQLAQNYTAEFEEMFFQKAFGPTSPANTRHPQIQLGDTLIETCFAAEDLCADQLILLISQSQKSIRFMAFSFTHQGLGQAVVDRAKAGVSVQGVFETRGSETEFSELGLMKKQKLDVWQDGNPYTLHHKVFILDDKTVVLGSFNFSDNADESNDENMLVIHNPGLAGQFLAEFNRVYAQAQQAQ
jgi:phosphatidylserine/phosphatidylglycerophosphate/cardiolipin synthase-like enzyme